MDRSKAGSRPVVLVVDDEELLRLYAADLLEEEGFSVIGAPNAEAALQVLERRPDVRLLFTDTQMPGPRDGMDLARLVHERWPQVLLVVTSGRVKPSPDEIPDDGRFVAKPYRPEELVGQVKDLVKNS